MLPSRPTNPFPLWVAWLKVRYLYAYPGGSLYQAAYLGERDDLDTGDCVLKQLKYKAANTETEEEN